MNNRRLFYCSFLCLILCVCLVAQGELVNRYSFTNGDTTAVDSVGGQHGSLVGGAVISGNAVELDGSNDYVNLPGPTIVINTFPAITLEMWSTQPTIDQGSSMTAALGGTWPNGAGRDYIMIATTRGDNVSRGAIANTPDQDAPWADEVGVNGPELNDGLEHQYVLTISNTEIAYYIDGVLQGTAPMGATTISGLSNEYAYLGRSVYTNDATVNCSINEFRIYNSVLTPEEIAQHYSDGPDVIGISPIVIQETDGSTEVIEGDDGTDEYTVALASQPQDIVILTVDPDEQLDIGNGRGNPVDIVFDTENWDSERTVVVRAFDDDVLEAEPHIGVISHTVSSTDPDFNDIPLPAVCVIVRENECGAWGYNYADLNYDCRVNFKDFAIFASYWPSPLNPIPLETFVSDWLKTTQPYAPDAEPGPVLDSPDQLVIEPDEIVSEIDEKVYGHFLEHIYHSVNGGLWGELVWNRSLEQWPGGVGTWSIDGDELVQSSLATDVRLLFGSTAWQDYEYTLQAKKTGGAEGFLIIFRANGDDFYWCNLGGWGNVKHALEKSVDGGGRGTVGPQVAGSIATDHWYDIRIRCEAGHYQVWLDGDLIIDWTDGSPHLSGQVGVGTWSTVARFRNITVTEIGSGTILFSGLPSVNENQAVPLYWTGYGTGTFYLSSGALNSDFCLQINNNDGTESGIKQTRFNITSQSYSGSVWARGSAAGSMVVRLLDGVTILGEDILPAPTSNWVEYPFSITPASSAQNATLQVGVTGVGTVYLDQISMMGQDSIDTGGFRPDLLQAVDDLRPPIIRWPGGCFAEFYRWKDGIGPQYQRVKYPIEIWDDQDVSSYGTDEFIAMCRIVGAEPLIVINIGSHDSIGKRPEYIQEALDWIEYCNGPADSTWGSERAANGHPEPYNVKYWEIDNETWFMGAGAYCQAVQDFAPVMAEKDPNIKVAACGSGGLGEGGEVWNQTVMDECADIIDYISIHHYENPNLYHYGPINFEGFIEELGDVIADSNNPDVKIYASEWNAQSTDWRTGLYAGGLLNAFERTSDVFEIGGPALFLRHLSATGWDNAFINFDHTGWFPAPNYVVMKLWRDNYARYRINMTGPVGGLNAIATKSADGNEIYFKAVNLTDQSVPVKLVISGAFDAGSASLQLVAPDSLWARNTLENPDTVGVEERYVGLNNQTIRFSMPRLSAGVVKVVRKE